MRQLKITKQITNRDSKSFNKYLNEVSAIGDTITAEEETELTKRIREGDMVAREKLIKANLRFVISVAKQYSGQAPLPDLIQEGNAGLIKAAERFDETRGFKFISFAVWWIRQSIMQYVAEHGRLIRLPQNKIGVLNKINKAKSELEQVYGRDATIDELSEYLTISEENKDKGEPSKYTPEKIKKLIESGYKSSSLDAPMTNESDSGTLHDIIKGESEYDVNKRSKNNDLRIEIERFMKKLTIREKETIILYYGLFGNRQMSLEEIGQRFELSRERVRQIKEKAIRKLRYTSFRDNLKTYL